MCTTFRPHCIHHMPSVLWRCWLGGRKGIWPVKILSGGVLAWLSVWSKVCVCVCVRVCVCVCVCVHVRVCIHDIDVVCCYMSHAFCSLYVCVHVLGTLMNPATVSGPINMLFVGSLGQTQKTQHILSTCHYGVLTQTASATSASWQ